MLVADRNRRMYDGPKRVQAVPLSLRERAGVRGTFTGLRVERLNLRRVPVIVKLPPRGAAPGVDASGDSPHPNPLPKGEGDLKTAIGNSSNSLGKDSLGKEIAMNARIGGKRLALVSGHSCSWRPAPHRPTPTFGIPPPASGRRRATSISSAIGR